MEMYKLLMFLIHDFGLVYYLIIIIIEGSKTDLYKSNSVLHCLKSDFFFTFY